MTGQPTPTADLIRNAIADAVTINAGPLIDHAATGVLYALGLVEVPPADGAPGPLTHVTDHTHTGPHEACDTERFGETCGRPASEHQLHDAELTADEARAEVDRLASELYRAQDALDYVGEWCDLTDRKQLPITTADVRTWLKGARCGRQLAADRGAAPIPCSLHVLSRATGRTHPAHDWEPQPGMTPVHCPGVPAASDDGLREQYAAAIRRVDDGDLLDTHDVTTLVDAVLAVRDRRLEQLTAGRATWKAKATEIEADRDQLDETARRFVAQRQEMAAERHGWQQRAETAEAKLAAARALADQYPVAIDTAHLHAALDGQDPAEDIDDWCDQLPDDPPATCTATLRMCDTVIPCTDHRPGIHRGPLPNSASTHAWGDYAPGATPHADTTKEG